MEDLSISPEPVIVYGKFWPRFAAAFIDGLILWIPGKILGMVMGADILITQLIKRYTTGDQEMDLGHVVAIVFVYELLAITIAWLYSAILESGPQQATFGKRALGLVVTDLHGERISFAKATGRHFGKYISSLILCIGYLMNIWDERGQTLHDKLAGTLVIKKRSY